MVEARWLSVDEIAAYLGVGRETIYSWIDKRDLPAHRVGRFWKFQKEDVDNWIKSGKAADDIVSGTTSRNQRKTLLCGKRSR